MAATFARVGRRREHGESQPCQPYADNFREVIIEKIAKIVDRRVGDGDKRTHENDQRSPESRLFRHLQLQQLHRQQQWEQEQHKLPQVTDLHHQAKFDAEAKDG